MMLKNSLIITDIHIGFESDLAINDIHIGKNSATQNIISEITDIIKNESPDNIILLGDIKSGIKNITKQEWIDVPLFFKEISKLCDVVVVPGNHDANIQKLIPNDTSMISPTGMIQDKILLTHGHTMPSSNISYVEKIIMGHVHPVFFQKDSILNGQRVWVSIIIDKQDIFPERSGNLEITIMPSFNRYFYATHKKQYKKSISPIIERVKSVISARIITLDGTIIGDESMLDHVI